MVIRTYNIELNMSEQSKEFWKEYLTQSTSAYNDCAKYITDNNIPLQLKIVHEEVYHWLRGKYTILPAQAIIKIYKDVLAALRSIKSNKHEDAEVPLKKNLALRIDKRLYSNFSVEGIALTGEQKNKRTFTTFKMYAQAELMFSMYVPKDPLLFMRGNRIFLSVPFEVPEKPCQNKDAIGVDLGVRRFVTTSEGKYIVDKKYLKRKREVRYLKRKLKEKGTKSAKRHLSKVKHIEHNITKDMCYKTADMLLNNTDASILVLEDLSKIKQNTKTTANGYKRKRHNNMLSQVPFYKFKEILTYKAQLVGKRVETVSPAYTSQIDSRTNKKDGKRQGCRYYCSDGVVLDADWNAAINICKRSKRPTSSIIPYDGGITPLVGRSQSTDHTLDLFRQASKSSVSM